MAVQQALKNENGEIQLYVSEVRRRPKGVLVCVHGGPNGDHRGNENVFEEIAEYCVDLGYSIVQFDMFGAGKSDGAAADISLRTQKVDFDSVCAFANARLSGPIHVIGESMGATIPALEWRTDVASYVLLWPAFDLRNTDLEPYLTDKWLEVARAKGKIEDNGMVMGLEFIEELERTDFRPCFDLPAEPCLLVHGKKDTAVPFQQSVVAIARAKGDCVLFANSTGDHGLQRPHERSFTHAAIRWWLQSR